MKVQRCWNLKTSLLLLLSLSLPVMAEDAISGSIAIPQGQAAPLMTVNGSGQTPGTYAIGTIQLWYTVTAFTFPSGEIANFDLNLQYNVDPQKPKTPTYPVTLTVRQVGKDLTLAPNPSSVAVTDTNFSGTSRITISVPDGAPSADGTELVGNLQLETPGNSRLGTVTTVQVHVKLVYPTACLKLYDFITKQGLDPFSSLTVNVNRNQKITGTNPPQLSDNILLVNTCSMPHDFSLEARLDSDFATNPSGNPGNAVFLYTSSDTAEPTVSTISSYATGVGAAKQQATCLPGLTIQAHQTILMAVHMALNNKILNPDALPAKFAFGASVYGATGACSGSLDTLATPNEVTVDVGYALASNGN